MSFDGKLCWKYLYQKLAKSDNLFSSYSQKCQGCFLRQCILNDIGIGPILSSNCMFVNFMPGHLVRQFHVGQIYVRHFQSTRRSVITVQHLPRWVTKQHFSKTAEFLRNTFAQTFGANSAKEKPVRLFRMKNWTEESHESGTRKKNADT